MQSMTWLKVSGFDVAYSQPSEVLHHGSSHKTSFMHSSIKSMSQLAVPQSQCICVSLFLSNAPVLPVRHVTCMLQAAILHLLLMVSVAPSCRPLSLCHKKDPWTKRHFDSAWQSSHSASQDSCPSFESKSGYKVYPTHRGVGRKRMC